MYQNVLLVTDLNDDTDLVAAKAKWVLQISPNIQLSVLHIVEETMLGFGYELIPASALHEEIDEERCQTARTRLAQVLERNDLQAHDAKIKPPFLVVVALLIMSITMPLTWLLLADTNVQGFQLGLKVQPPIAFYPT